MVVATMADSRRVRAKLIVGADGNGSACRKFVQVRHPMTFLEIYYLGGTHGADSAQLTICCSALCGSEGVVQGTTKPEYVGAAVWRMFLPGENPFVNVSDSLVLTGDGKVLSYSRKCVCQDVPVPGVQARCCLDALLA